ncbi:MAG: Fic family protein [Sulfurifustaceae bacterium]
MLFQPPPLTEREAEVIAEIETIRRRMDLPRFEHWPGLTWRAITDRLLRIAADAGANGPVDVPAPEEDAAEKSADIWTAAAGYRAALSFALQLADAAHFAYDEGVIRALHYMITMHDPTKKPARWRRGSIWVRRQTTGEILYTPPPPKSIPALMTELIATLNERNDQPPIVRAAMAHLNVAAIHPFADGNGRTSRAVHTLVLARAGVTAPPFASIDEYVSARTDDYDQALREVHGGAWQPERDTRPWVRFCLTAHFYQATMLERRSREYDRLWEALECEAMARGLPDHAMSALARAAVGERVTAPVYASAAGGSSLDADRELRELADAGLLIAATEEGEDFYLASEQIKAIWSRVREPGVQAIDPFA